MTELRMDAPNEKQRRFLLDRHRHIAYGGARGGGKSWAVRTKAKLLALRYVYQKDKFRVVPKDIIKKELGRSPDKADAFALTFAFPVAPKGAGGFRVRRVSDIKLEDL